MIPNRRMRHIYLICSFGLLITGLIWPSDLASAANADTTPIGWNGPASKVIYDDNGAGILIGGTRHEPRFIQLQGFGATDERDWTIRDYEMSKALSHGVSIVSIDVGYASHSGNGWWHDEIISHLQKAGSPYVFISLGLYPIPKPSPFNAMKVQTRENNIGSYDNYQTLSADTIEGMKTVIRDTLDYYNKHYPGKVIGITPCYLNTGEWFTWPNYYDKTGGHWEIDYWANYEPTHTYLKGWPDYNDDVKAAFGYSAAQPLPSVLKRSTPSYGNYFHTAANADGAECARFNRFISQRVGNAITELAQYIKTITDNKILVRFYTGYISELESCADCPTSGASNVGSFRSVLNSPYVDIFTSANSYTLRGERDTIIIGGPMESPSTYKTPNSADPSGYSYKMWVVEDDSRTHLGKLTNPALDHYCSMSLENNIKYTRYSTFHSALRQSGIHYFDLESKGWWGNPAYQTESDALWDAISTAIDQSKNIRLNAPGSYAPEIAVFCDDESLSLTMLDPHEAATGLSDVQYHNMRLRITRMAVDRLTHINTPIRYYLSADILQPAFPADKIKLAVFINTFKLSDAERAAITQKLKKDGKTLLFIYATGLARDDYVLDPANISSITGISIKRGASTCTLESNVNYGTAADGIYKYSGNYGNMGLNADPWFYVDSQAPVTVLGRYTGKPLPDNRSVVEKDFGTYKVIYSASPDMPLELYRAIAKKAGVNMFSSVPEDIIEASGDTVMVYGAQAGVRSITFPFYVKDILLERDCGAQMVNVNGNTLALSILSPGEVVLLHFTKDNEAPVAGSITPLSGSSYADEEKTFTATYSDYNGSTDLRYCHIRFVNPMDPDDHVRFYYDQDTGLLHALPDVAGGKAPGSTGALAGASGKAALNCALTTIVNTPRGITINWTVSFNHTFKGAKQTQLASIDDMSQSTGYVDKGTWTVQVVNSSPVLAAIGPKTINENATLTFTATATDLDPGPVFNYTLTNAPTGASIGLTTGIFSWTPGYDLGRTTPPYYATVNVTDGQGGSDSETIAITVSNVNRAPSLGTVSKSQDPVATGVPAVITSSVSDPDGKGNIAVSAIHVVSTNGAFSNGFSAYYNIWDGKLRLCDDAGAWMDTAYTPGTAGAKLSNSQVIFDCEHTRIVPDADPGKLVIEWHVTFKSSFGGQKYVCLCVRDKEDLSEGHPIPLLKGTWSINRPPEITNIGGVTSIPCGGTLTLNVTAKDLDGQTLIYSALKADGSALPAHASIAQTGIFTFSPDSTQAGIYDIRFTVSDGSLSASATSRITVTAVSSFNINSGMSYSRKRAVTLDVSCPGLTAPVQARFSNDNVTWTAWEAYYVSGRTWKLTRGYGTKTVYAQLKDGAGDIKPVMSDTIDLSYTKPVIAMDLDNDLKDDYIVSFGQTGSFMYSSKDSKWYEVAKGVAANYLVKANFLGDTTENDLLADFSIPGSPFNGVWIKKNSQAWSQVAGVNTQGLAAADINNDSKDEVVCYFPDNGGVHVYNISTGAWTPWALPGVWSMTVCDADNNGKDDVIFDFKDANGLYIFMNSANWVEMARGAHGQWIEAGDIDADNNDEAVIDFGAIGLYTWDREKAQPWTKISGGSKDSQVFTLANIDGDGDKDVLSVFGMPEGVERYDNTTKAWSDYDASNNLDCEYIVAGESNGTSRDEVVIAIEGPGLYVKYDDIGDWRPMANIDAQ